MRSVTLDELAPGQRATVEQIDGPPDLTQRLAELGLFEGETLELVAFALLGDPLEIRLGNTRLSLRKREAKSVRVTIIGPEPPG